MRENCFLVLEDGSVHPGRAFGATAPTAAELTQVTLGSPAAGEVVFNTGMSGYPEILTDPSYTGQIVLMTYPHIGNYGVDPDWSEVGPESGLQRRLVKPSGFVIRDYYDGPIPQGRITLDAFLAQQGIPGITQVDTRKLTIRIRNQGSPIGIIVRPIQKDAADLSKEEMDSIQKCFNAYPKMEGSNLVSYVGTAQTVRINPEGKQHFVLVDYGIKANILREMTKRGCVVTLVSSKASADEILSFKPCGVLLSNGPGDPRVLEHAVQTAKALIGVIPLFGICLGHQLITLALGGRIYKMKFGHHGLNHPVRDELTQKVFVTSQNHGFAAEESSLPQDVTVWFKNANDQSIEGLCCPQKNVYCAQFHPEAAPGPTDSSWIFDRFLECAAQAK